MASKSRTVRTGYLFEWQTEDRIHLIKSFVGSSIEFREKCSRRQRVVGTLDKCENNGFNLIDASIDGEFFGDYVINDYEISKWRLREYHKKDRPLIKGVTDNRGDSSKRGEEFERLVIPSRLHCNDEETEADKDLIHSYPDDGYEQEVETINLNEDEKPLEIDLKPLSLKASNDIVFFDSMSDPFFDVIQNLSKTSSLGFAVFGEDVSRNGVIDLMAFATEDAIYVFDSNNSGIIGQLKPILESTHNQKVMFALRHQSDALYHLFDINLENAVDVRVWDLSLQRKNFKSAYLSAKPELRSFDKILWTYLTIKPPKYGRDLNFKRITTKIKNFIRLQTILLRELFDIINRKLLEEVYQMNKTCLRSLRTTEGLEYEAIKTDQMELEILSNPVFASEEEEERLIYSLNTNKPINGFKGKEIVIRSDEEIVIDSDEELDEIMVRLTPKS